MKIDMHTPFSGYVLVIKDDRVLGLVQELDTDTKEFVCRHIKSGELQRGVYDRAVINYEGAVLPKEYLESVYGDSVELITTEELEQIRKDITERSGS